MYTVSAYKNDEWDGYIADDMSVNYDEELDEELDAKFLFQDEIDGNTVARYAFLLKLRTGELFKRKWRFEVKKAVKHTRTEVYYT